MNRTVTTKQVFNPLDFLQQILNIPGMTNAVACTYKVLAHYNKDKGCFPKLETVAAVRGLCVRQIRRHVSVLERMNLIRRQVQSRRNGSQSSNLIVFIPQAQLSSGGPMSALLVPEKKTQETHNTTNGIELRQPPAERGPVAAKAPECLLALRDTIQRIHDTLPGGSLRWCTFATRRTASWFRHRASQAVGRKLTAAEVVAELMSHGFARHLENLKRRRRVPMSISGICEYLYNWLAPSDRQTENYNPAAYLPSPTHERVLTAEWMEAA